MSRTFKPPWAAGKPVGTIKPSGTAGKYHAKKTESGGIVFDSAREARRWQELNLIEKAGRIRGLRRQVRYRLIPPQRLSDGRRERPVDYVADFVYVDCATGATVVEDTKGMRTRDYIIKRKLMKYVHGIELREV